MRSVQSSLLSLHKNIIHAFSTKQNGNSNFPFAQNNLAYHVNDDPKIVYKNHQNYAKYLNYDIQKLIYMQQIHSDKIMIIDKSSDLASIPQCDALITQEKNIPLMVMVADCVPILIYDPIHKVIAVVHAGRAGTFKKILEKTLNLMKNKYDTEAEDIEIVLGPSIRQCCYEVGDEIIKEATRLNYDSAIKYTDDKKMSLDLIHILKEQLKHLGTPIEQVEISPYCTSCNKELFFSYRAEHNNTGRFSGLIMLK